MKGHTFMNLSRTMTRRLRFTWKQTYSIFVIDDLSYALIFRFFFYFFIWIWHRLVSVLLLFLLQMRNKNYKLKKKNLIICRVFPTYIFLFQFCNLGLGFGNFTINLCNLHQKFVLYGFEVVRVIARGLGTRRRNGLHRRLVTRFLQDRFGEKLGFVWLSMYFP